MGILDFLNQKDTTANIIVVSRTKMGGENVCVGAFDINNNRNIRLLTASGSNQPRSFPLNIGSTIKATYAEKSGTKPPHTEDVLLKGYEATAPGPVLKAFQGLCKPITGPITNTFSGCLSKQGGNALSIGSDNVPDHSVCFWRADAPLTLDTSFDSVKYNYGFGFNRVSIKFVGFQETIRTIPSGSIIRLSLARWWCPPGHNEERCYLQLSGWHL